MTADWADIRARFRSKCEAIVTGYVAPEEKPESPLVKAGRRLADFRRARGLSQEALAHKAGYDRFTITRAERGLGTGPAVRADIAEALGLRLEDIWPT